MHVQRICVPATWRARLHLSALAHHGVLIPREVLNAARRDLGAGPTWGRTVATLMLVGYSAVSLLLARAGLVATASAVVGLVTVGVLLAGTAVRLGRGIDVNRWLTVNPRHQRGSCQWLIWRGEQTGRPCVHCLAGMSRQERRHWLEAAASPAAVVAGWIGDLPKHADTRTARASDAGAVPVAWLAFQLLPVAFLVLAVTQWASTDPQARATVLPLSLATMVTAAINLLHPRAAGNDNAGSVTDHAPADAQPRECESCRLAPATVSVQFVDGVRFTVCAGCLAAGAHAATDSGTRTGRGTGEAVR